MEELKQNIYLPFDGEDEVRIVEEQVECLNRNEFYQLGQSIIYRLFIMYGFKEKLIINFQLTDFDRAKKTLQIDYDEESSIHIKLREDVVQDLEKYCALHKYKERKYLFTKKNGMQLTPDSILGTLKGRMKRLEISNFNPTSVALYGVANLIDKGFTLAEIKILTGFETQKIEDVSQYLLTDENVEDIINKKL